MNDYWGIHLTGVAIKYSVYSYGGLSQKFKGTGRKVRTGLIQSLPHCPNFGDHRPHQGAVSHEHLAYYLDEYTFRFTQRTSTHRGKLFFRLLQNAMEIEPTKYTTMIRNVRGRKPKNHKI